MATNQDVMAKAARILAMADRPGTAAEGQTAQALLDRLCTKYGITVSQVRAFAAPPKSPTPPAPRTCPDCGKPEGWFPMGASIFSTWGANDRCADCVAARKREIADQLRRQREAQVAEQLRRQREAEEAERRREAERLSKLQEQIAREQRENERLRRQRRPVASSNDARRGREKVYYARDYNWTRKPVTAGTKRHLMWQMMSRPEGATTSELCAELGWTHKGLHGAISELKRGRRGAGIAA